MFMLRKTKKPKTDQSGLVSLIVVAILAVVLGLVAVGFSKLMDRELRQSLDRELSAQAFYSALAGLDDARAYLGAGGTGFDKCNSPPSLGQYFTSDLSGSSGIAKYSCVTIDTQPDNLVYQLGKDQSVTFQISKPNMGRMYFSWQNDQTPSSFTPLGSLGSLPQESSITSQTGGLLEVNLYPIPNGFPGSSDTNATLSSLSRTYYMYPNGGSGTPGCVSYSGSNCGSGSIGKGGFVPGNCKIGNTFKVGGSSANPQMCNSFISGINLSPTNFYVRITARYNPIDVTVQAATNGGQSLTQIPNAQAIVDVTGQGTDVLQRIRARIDIGNNFQTPLYGVQSMESICKGFDVSVTSPGTYGPSTSDSNISANIDQNGVCDSIPSTGGTTTTGIPSGFGPH